MIDRPVSSGSSRARRRWLIPATLIFLAVAGLAALTIAVETMAIVWLDRWLPVATMESALAWSLAISALAEGFRLVLVGAGVYLLAGRIPTLSRTEFGRAALIFWSAVVLGLTVALLAVDLFQNGLHFRNPPLDQVAIRSAFLALLYLKLVFYFISFRLLLGAPTRHAGAVNAAWRAARLWPSLGLFLVAVAVWLAVDSVLVTLLSYIPVIAPLWFIDDGAPSRELIGQGTRVVAESLGVVAYVCYWLWATGHASKASKAMT